MIDRRVGNCRYDKDKVRIIGDGQVLFHIDPQNSDAGAIEMDTGGKGRLKVTTKTLRRSNFRMRRSHLFPMW
ncbi:MAG: hypothetical protein KDB79_16110 [Acidobacteria bacterium]|nr:hypothetical protein [Acidobacteriota bacterium]